MKQVQLLWWFTTYTVRWKTMSIRKKVLRPHTPRPELSNLPIFDIIHLSVIKNNEMSYDDTI